ncbi:MAG: bifunctional serine/threonine-protein kinase/formylglycine-generating enzyme family protein [Planctomycetota bacterium]
MKTETGLRIPAAAGTAQGQPQPPPAAAEEIWRETHWGKRRAPLPVDLSADLLLSAAPRVSYEGLTVPAMGGIPLLFKLGQGGVGAVYFGIHPRTMQEVAVKVLAFHVAQREPEAIARFCREAQAAANIQSPHLVRVQDVNEEKGLYYLVMEYVAGVSANGCLKQAQRERLGGLSEAVALDICIASTKGLAAAHKAGIIHRDVKPDNILIPRDQDSGQLLYREAKLADLGLARSEDSAYSATQSAIAMGTPGFMAPEQGLSARTAGKPADVFSTCATLYVLLAGKMPFLGETAIQVLVSTIQQPHLPLQQVCPTVSAATAALIDRCLAKEPERRYADAVELLEALMACRKALAAGAAQVDSDTEAGSSPESRIQAAIRARARAKTVLLPNAEKPAGAEAVTRVEDHVPAGTAAEPEAASRAEAAGRAGAQEEARGRGRAEARAREEAQAEAQRKAEEEAKARAEAEAEAREEAEAEAQRKAAAELRARTEAESWAAAKAEARARVEAEPRRLAEARAKAEAEARARAAAREKALREGLGKTDSAAFAPVEAAAQARVATYAKHSGLPLNMVLTLGREVELELVLVPPGSFKMGSPETERGRAPDETEHEATITTAFYMGKFPVTQEQYEAVVWKNPSLYKGPRNPVERVSWEDANEFCRKLRAKKAKNVRMPTEAEWEYACRADSPARFYCGDTIEHLNAMGWCFANSGSSPHPVGQKRPNAWGLFDMHGNVWQWCQDWYGQYPAGAVSNPPGAASGEYRVLRGGSWLSYPWICRAAIRLKLAPATRDFNLGFRIVVTGLKRASRLFGS